MIAVNAIATIPLQNEVAKNHAPKSVLCHCGDSDMMRSKAIREKTKANVKAVSGDNRRMMLGGRAILLGVRVHSRTTSRREAETNHRLKSVNSRRPPPSRANMNGAFNHIACFSMGCRIQGKISVRPAHKPQNRINP